VRNQYLLIFGVMVDEQSAVTWITMTEGRNNGSLWMVQVGSAAQGINPEKA
jgi:hypothetical protein